MKKLLTAIGILCSILTNGQELSKSDFNDIFQESGKILDGIVKGDMNQIEDVLKISGLENSESFKRIFTEDKIKFNDKTKYTFAHPYFYLTKTENVLELTIPGLKVLEQKDGESYQRSRYYFVLKTFVVRDSTSGKVYFEDTGIITDERDIEKWWLSQWKNYMPEVKKVSDKFGYTPPPPPSPPENLKS